MSSSVRRFVGSYIDDWTVLKYGWLAVFIIHIAFLAMGVFFLKRALNLEHPSLYSIPELRIFYALTAFYMITIAFSIILLIITVFAFEQFRFSRRMAGDLARLREDLGLGEVEAAGEAAGGAAEATED